MDRIFYPTIDLFRYKLKNALGSSQESIQRTQEDFVSQLPSSIQFKDDEQEHEYLELTNPKRPKFENGALKGYYYPVRLNDIYGLQLDCSLEDFTDPQPIETLTLVKEEIEKRLQKNTSITPLEREQDALVLGQTWLVSGWLPETPVNSPKDLSKRIYNLLFPNANWQSDLYGEAIFLNSHFFELWNPQSASHHVVIALFDNLETAKKAANFYTDWMGLFSYRHKVTWAYQQSRAIKKSLVNHYRNVNRNIEVLSTSSQNERKLSSLERFFDDIQDVLNLYTVDILNLSFQKQIIDINLFNYKQRLEFIKQKGIEVQGIHFFHKFSDFAENKYLEQINQDKESMQLGLQLLEDNINATRSRLDVEKAKQDQLFQTVIILITSGWAGATVAEQVIQPREWQGEPIRNYLIQAWDFPEKSAISIASFAYSLSGALILIIMILILNRFIPLLDVARRSK